MRTPAFVIIFFLFLQVSTAQSFDSFITTLNNATEPERQALVDQFMDTVSHLPYTEQDTLAHFVYQGAGNSVSVAGDATGWDPTKLFMQAVAGTNFWYYTARYEAAARLDYKFVINGSNWILDPNNPYTILGGYGPNSELRMPHFEMPTEIEYRPDISHGTVFDTSFYSSQLSNSRQILVYTPPGFNTQGKKYGLVVFHDGTDYLNLGSAKNILDNLLSEGRIDSLVCVFIPPVNRNAEYSGDDRQAFTSFVIEDILPWARERFHATDDKYRQLVVGVSNGGNISLWMAMNHPEVFANVAAQSSNIENYISAFFAAQPTMDIKLYLDLGLYDIPYLMPRVRNFIPILEDKSYEYFYTEYPDGHSWGFWRAYLDDVLEMFFPAGSSTIEEPFWQGSGVSLRPNPFYNELSFTIDSDNINLCSIRIYDANGRLLDTLSVSKNGHNVGSCVWKPQESLAAGLYYYQVLEGSKLLKTGKLIRKSH